MMNWDYADENCLKGEISRLNKEITDLISLEGYHLKQFIKLLELDFHSWEAVYEEVKRLKEENSNDT